MWLLAQGLRPCHGASSGSPFWLDRTNIECIALHCIALHCIALHCIACRDYQLNFKVENEPVNEVKEFIDHRVMSANEAMAGIYGFDVHRSSPPVMPLRVHLEDEQIAVFDEGDPEAAVFNPRSTELTAFFVFNQLPSEQSKELQDRPRYVDMPLKHVYDSKRGTWRVRKKGQDVIGRVHMPSALAGEVIYLRMLLHIDVCKGVQSFEELKLGKESYKEACRHLGLLQVTGIPFKSG